MEEKHSNKPMVNGFVICFVLLRVWASFFGGWSAWFLRVWWLGAGFEFANCPPPPLSSFWRRSPNGSGSLGGVASSSLFASAPSLPPFPGGAAASPRIEAVSLVASLPAVRSLDSSWTRGGVGGDLLEASPRQAKGQGAEGHARATHLGGGAARRQWEEAFKTRRSRGRSRQKRPRSSSGSRSSENPRRSLDAFFPKGFPLIGFSTLFHLVAPWLPKKRTSEARSDESISKKVEGVCGLWAATARVLAPVRAWLGLVQLSWPTRWKLLGLQIGALAGPILMEKLFDKFFYRRAATSTHATTANY
eukprot:GHVT01062451.1.p1 GENE.GHVT01062451.1~~GHVT01062451.1.p1  ORF type:complete len:304 (-),score=50.36 GHVT01062451.1:211-1122(-)